MSKEEAVLRYKASMALFKKWFAEGIISEVDLMTIETVLAEKYSLSSSSIYLEKDLLCKEKRANIP